MLRQRSNLKSWFILASRETGEIVGLKIVQPSGDPSDDESVLSGKELSNRVRCQRLRKTIGKILLTWN